MARLLAGYRDRPPADAAAIHRVLVRLSQMVIDLPELAELDINPLLADENGVLALDARVRVQKADGRGADRLAIRPCPRELEQRLSWCDRGTQFLVGDVLAANTAVLALARALDFEQLPGDERDRVRIRRALQAPGPQ